jgi:hypothetical protein
MNNEAQTKTMTSGQAFQLVSVISQSLGKIGLDFDLAKLLIDKPSITRRRLKALTGENPFLIVPQHQYATIERLDVRPNGSHHYQGDADYLTFNKDLEEVLTAPDDLVREYGSTERPRTVHRCDVVRTLGENEGLYPVFREALMYQGNDGGMWGTLYKRRAYWTIKEVLGFVYDEIHEGDSQLGLTEHSDEVVFPVLLTEKFDSFLRKMTYDRLGALVVSQGSLLRQKRKWHVSLYDGGGMLRFHLKTIYFANNPRYDEK